MTGLFRTVAIVALAVVLVAGTFLSLSILNPGPGAQVVKTLDSFSVEAEGNQAAPQPEGELKPSHETPSVESGTLVQPVGAPRDLIASWIDGSIVLTWLAPPGGTVTHYTVTRTRWDRRAQVEWFTVDSPASRYIDNNVRDGVTYTYAVTSHGIGQTSPPAGVMVTKTGSTRLKAPQLVREGTENVPTRALPQELATPIFDPEAAYDIPTRYGATTEVQLADYLSGEVGEVAFSIGPCDGSSGDYYDSVTVKNGVLRLVSNARGYVHGQNTETSTVCTLTASTGTASEEREIHLYTVPDRTPPELFPGALTQVEIGSNEMGLRVEGAGSHLGYVRLGWRKPGGRPSFAVAWGVTDSTVLAIPGLEPETTYEVRAYLMTRQAFHLYSAGSSPSAGVLIAETAPHSKWVGNLPGGGLGKSQKLTIQTASPSLPPTPTPEPTLPPAPVITLRPPPTQEPDDHDTPETDNDDRDDTPDLDTPEQNTPTPDPVTPDPDTPEQNTPTPDTPTPDTPTPQTSETGSDEEDSDQSS